MTPQSDAPPSAGRAGVWSGWPLRLTLLVALYLGFRVPWLSSIPPYTFDEGLLGLPAKNWIDLGNPLFGQNLNLLRFPLFTSLLAGAYSLFGHTILVSRTVSVAAGLAAAIVFNSIARRLLSASAAWWATLLFAVDFVLVRYQRYGLAESVQILLLLATVRVWLPPRSRGAILAPLVLGAAILLKPTSLQVLPALMWLDYQVLRHGESRLGAMVARPSVLRVIMPYLASFGMVALVYGALWASWPREFVDAWSQYLPGAFQIADLPRTTALLVLGSPLAFLGPLLLARGTRASRDPKIRFLAVWLVSGFLFLVALRAHPVRYYATLVPPGLLFGGVLVERSHDALRSRLGTTPGHARRRASVAAALALSILAYESALFGAYYFLRGERDASAVNVAQWVRASVPKTCQVLGPAHLGVDIPQVFLDMTSMGAIKLSSAILATHNISYVLYDAGWRSLSGSRDLGVGDSLRSTCDFLIRIDSVEIWRAESSNSTASGEPRVPATEP
jgi:4-amino-4-deoxy-L-arabinose transferase-like glycosyltransferase